MHRSHLVVDGVYDCACLSIVQVVSNGMFWSFSFQMCLLSSVLFSFSLASRVSTIEYMSRLPKRFCWAQMAHMQLKTVDISFYSSKEPTLSTLNVFVYFRHHQKLY